MCYELINDKIAPVYQKGFNDLYLYLLAIFPHSDFNWDNHNSIPNYLFRQYSSLERTNWIETRYTSKYKQSAYICGIVQYLIIEKNDKQELSLVIYLQVSALEHGHGNFTKLSTAL
jgi:hypothetical protein